jgi:hypothetical protein
MVVSDENGRILVTLPKEALAWIELMANTVGMSMSRFCAVLILSAMDRPGLVLKIAGKVALKVFGRKCRRAWDRLRSINLLPFDRLAK